VSGRLGCVTARATGGGAWKINGKREKTCRGWRWDGPNVIRHRSIAGGARRSRHRRGRMRARRPASCNAGEFASGQPCSSVLLFCVCVTVQKSLFRHRLGCFRYGGSHAWLGCLLVFVYTWVICVGHFFKKGTLSISCCCELGSTFFSRKLGPFVLTRVEASGPDERALDMHYRWLTVLTCFACCYASYFTCWIQVLLLAGHTPPLRGNMLVRLLGLKVACLERIKCTRYVSCDTIIGTLEVSSIHDTSRHRLIAMTHYMISCMKN
jgi:hypothetical protein